MEEGEKMGKFRKRKGIGKMKVKWKVTGYKQVQKSGNKKAEGMHDD
jgi:hypothetical protein